MRKFVSVVIASAVLAAPMAAQQANPDAQCPPGTTTAGIPNQQRATQDDCQKAIDLFKYLAPQLGTALAGGAPTLGQGGPTGGLGGFSFGLRVNGVMGDMPQAQDANVQPDVNGVQRDTYRTEGQIIPLPTADLAIGLFGGLPLGVTSVGGLDVLVSATYLPEFEADNIKVEADGSSLKFGLGLKLGLLEESLVVPGVSVSYIRRDLPKINITARSGADSLQVRDLDVQTTSWRIMASKSIFMFGVAVGGGKDRYESGTIISARTAARTVPPVPAQTAGPIDIEQTMTRTNVFLDLSFNLAFFKLVGEIGQVSGGKVETYNQFEGSKADDSRTYGSIGIRFGF
ncbi:MAG TPA: hypothetical protein VMY38_00950 [Gemmatimonadaceae bacterium]|nr:hypothetical protein [Gemmatimonadaceae bacterium]